MNLTTNVLPFITGHRPPSLWHQEIIDPMDGAVFDVESAASDMADILHRDVTTIDEALTMSRRIDALVVTLQDVQKLALGKAARLCR